MLNKMMQFWRNMVQSLNFSGREPNLGLAYYVTSIIITVRVLYTSVWITNDGYKV